MPRPNQARTIASEQSLARRIAIERESRGWSYDGLASRMTKAGCSIQSSAIYKIEKSNPPRRITVDELVGFSEVFGISLENLLLPPEMAAKERLVTLVSAWDAARVAARAAEEAAAAAWAELQDYVRAQPDIESDVEDVMAAWMDYYFEPDADRGWAVEKIVGDLTGSVERKEAAAAKFHERVI